ncbi:MAG TPA: MFS transporter [Ilumatobacteraceae bacterium]|nr:MFS transporter [Ilumatobacteraceae bacterium]
MTIETEPSTPAEPARPGRPANALTSRPFRFLWLNNVTFFLVANAQRFVFGWLVLDGLQRGEGQQGLVVFTLGLPAALLVLQAGVWADRFDRRRMLIATQVAGTVVMAATAVLVGTDRIDLGWVVLLTLLAGSASAIGSPVRASLIPALVAKEQLFGAIALNAIAMTLSLIIGPVLAKAVGDRYGFEGAFWFQTGLMVLGLVFLLRLRVPPHEHVVERRSVLTETKMAIRHVVDDPRLRTLFGLLLTASFTINPAVMVTIQAHVKEDLGRTAGDAAIPFALMGLGMAITSFVVMRKGDMANKGAVFQRAMMCGATITFLTGLSNSFVQVVVLAFAMGLAGGFFINMNQGLIQANTPQAVMGRVMGLYTLVTLGLMPFGALALGVLAAVIGPGAAISTAAVVAFAVVTTTYVRNAELRRLA